MVRAIVRPARLLCIALARAGQREVSAIRSRGVTATQGFLQTLLKAISVWTPVSVRYRAGVRNSGVSVRRGSTVICSPIPALRNGIGFKKCPDVNHTPVR